MLDFPNAPNIGDKYPQPPVAGVPVYTWDGEKWTTVGGATGGKTPVYTDGSSAMTAQLTVVDPPVHATDAASKNYVDAGVASSATAVKYSAQTLTASQKAQARANIDVMKKNYIINGAMMVSQENGSTASGVNTYYAVDQFKNSFSSAGTISFGQVASRTPGGSPNRIRTTVTAPDASVGSTDYVVIVHPIEGLRFADLGFGTAAAKTITVQFGVKAPAGVYGVAFINGPNTRCYAAEYTIGAGEANTDVVKSVTIPGDVTGSWPTDNTAALFIEWGMMAGNAAGYGITPNVWTAGSCIGSINQSNFMAVNGNVFELFDVSLTEGAVAPPFQVPDYATELALCRRYFYAMPPANYGFPSPNSGGYAALQRYDYKVTMRTAPTVTGTYNNQSNVAGINFSTRTPDFHTDQVIASTSTNTSWTYSSSVNARL